MQFMTGPDGRRGGALFKLIVFLGLTLGVLVAAWIFFLPTILASTLTKRTGFPVKVERMVLNPFAANVDIDGLVVSNPHTYPVTDYIKVRNFQARAPIATFLGHKADFEFVRVEVSSVAFVRNTDGTFNATMFYDRLFPSEKPPVEEEKGKRPTNPPKPSAKQPDPTPAPAPKKLGPFFIQRLELKVDHVLVADYFGRNPTSREYNLKVDQIYFNVSDAKQLLTPATVKSIAPAATAIGALVPGDLGKILGAAAGNLNLRDTPKKTTDAVKSLVDTLEESRKP